MIRQQGKKELKKIFSAQNTVLFVAFAVFFTRYILNEICFRLTKQMPAGRAFVCMDLKNIPQILQQIFTASMLNTA